MGIMLVTATEFVMDKAAAGRIAVMTGVAISRYARKERMGAQTKSKAFIPAD